MPDDTETQQEAQVVKQGLDYWSNRWVEGRTGWHVNKVNPHLLTNFEAFTGRKINVETGLPIDGDVYDTQNPKTVFIPLCGKSQDIKFFLKLGYRVFGVEFVEKVVAEFNDEEGFGLVRKEEDGHVVYQSEDERCIIYCGDILKCPVEKWGPFDLVWDRGSLIAVDYDARFEYIAVMKRSVQTRQNTFHHFRYLLEVVNYDRTKYPGPPRAVDEKDMKNFYSDWTEFKVLQSTALPEQHPVRQVPGIGLVDSHIYIISPK